MLWCIKRAAEADKTAAETSRADAEKAKSRSRSKGKTKELPTTVEGDEMVAAIINDLLKAQSQGEIEDQIFSVMVSFERGYNKCLAWRSGDECLTCFVQSDPKPDTGLRPHPRNVSNREVEIKFNRDIARLVYVWLLTCYRSAPANCSTILTIIETRPRKPNGSPSLLESIIAEHRSWRSSRP
jgi:hypothetical protein